MRLSAQGYDNEDAVGISRSSNGTATVDRPPAGTGDDAAIDNGTTDDIQPVGVDEDSGDDWLDGKTEEFPETDRPSTEELPEMGSGDPAAAAVEKKPRRRKKKEENTIALVGVEHVDDSAPEADTETAEAAPADVAEQNQPTPPAELPADVKVSTEGESEPMKVEPLTDSVLALREWEKSVRDAQHEVDEYFSTYEELKEEAKEAKKDWEASVQRLGRAIRSEPRPMPLFDKKPATAKSESPATTDQPETSQPGDLDVASDAPISAPAAVASDAWRRAPLSDLGLTPALAEKLTEAGCTTIGKLEDLRAAVALGYEKYPKGIGKGKITIIEDAVISWLSIHRDKEILAQAAAGSSEPAEAAPETETTSADGETGSPPDYSWNEHTPEEKAAAIHRRAGELNTGEKECLAPSHEEDGTRAHYDQGFAAYETGEPVTSCCYAPGKYQDAWLKGWMSAQILDEHEGSAPVVDGEEIGIESGDLEFEEDGNEDDSGGGEYLEDQLDDLLDESAADVEGEMNADE